MKRILTRGMGRVGGSQQGRVKRPGAGSGGNQVPTTPRPQGVKDRSWRGLRLQQTAAPQELGPLVKERSYYQPTGQQGGSQESKYSELGVSPQRSASHGQERVESASAGSNREFARTKFCCLTSSCAYITKKTIREIKLLQVFLELHTQGPQWLMFSHSLILCANKSTNQDAVFPRRVPHCCLCIQAADTLCARLMLGL